MELTGTVEVVLPVEHIGAKKTPKQTVVLKTEDGKYEQFIPVEFFGKAVTKLDGVEAGQVVTISIDIRGRKWENPQGEVKYFSNINGWRIQRANAGGNTYPPPEGGGGSAGGWSPPPGDGDDNIPFRYL